MRIRKLSVSLTGTAIGVTARAALPQGSKAAASARPLNGAGR